MTVKTLQDLLAEGVEGRYVLVRSDFNVPLNDKQEITDSGRIKASLPTPQHCPTNWGTMLLWPAMWWGKTPMSAPMV